MIISYIDLSSINKTPAQSIVYARGAFDLLHAGHIDFIEFAKRQGDILVIGIISDEVVRQNKGDDRPIQNEQERLRLVDAIKGVDYTLIVPPPTSRLTSTELVIRHLKPDIFVLFDEKEIYTAHFKEILNQYGTTLILDTSSKQSSTTDIVRKIRK